MTELLSALTAITQNVAARLNETGFSAVIPEDCKKGDLPVKVLADGTRSIEYVSENGGIKIEFFDNRVFASISTVKDEDGSFVEYQKPIEMLLELETCDEKDISYISSEIDELIVSKFGKKDGVANKVKAQKTVSKAAVKSGSVYYDANTLAKRLTSSVFPELQAQYNANIQKYAGVFFAEEFFVDYGTPAVMALIRANDQQKMKKLFNILNEIYPDATNETQSLIAVTVLGEIDNDQELLARCVDYMCPDLLAPVLEVNRFLATVAGKRAKEKLKNPPPYKPKKKKSGGIMSSLMGGAQPPQQK